MRYTTVIDISQSREIYRNLNVRLVYLHLCLKAGYHDHDRDLVRTSIRNLAADTGLTVAAVRHALNVLLKWRLLSRSGELLQVVKWVPEQSITNRPKNSRQARELDQAAQRKAMEERREKEAELERIRRENLAAQGSNSLDEYRRHLKEKAQAGDIEAQELLRRRNWE